MCDLCALIKRMNGREIKVAIVDIPGIDVPVVAISGEPGLCKEDAEATIILAAKLLQNRNRSQRVQQVSGASAGDVAELMQQFLAGLVTTLDGDESTPETSAPAGPADDVDDGGGTRESGGRGVPAEE